MKMIEFKVDEGIFNKFKDENKDRCYYDNFFVDGGRWWLVGCGNDSFCGSSYGRIFLSFVF